MTENVKLVDLRADFFTTVREGSVQPIKHGVKSPSARSIDLLYCLPIIASQLKILTERKTYSSLIHTQRFNLCPVMYAV